MRLHIITRPVRFALALAFLAIIWPWSVQAQAVPQTSASIRKIFVDKFQGDLGSSQLRESVIQSLRAHGKYTLVDKPSDADATVRGTGEIWVDGYVANRPHSAVRETVYNGYLSLEVSSRSGETLWSYLVTPGRMYSDAAHGMADHIVRLMVAALARDRTPSAPATAPATGEVALSGAGSTFSAPLYQEWIQSFEAQHPLVHTTYQSVGSEQGIEWLKEGKVDFAASDVPLSDEQMAGMGVKFDNIATVLGGVVPAYNLPGIGRDLRFTPAILAAIYLGKVTNWNDPKLRTLNRGLSLPDKPIVVVHRSDGSGTSYTWTSFLSAASPEWKASAGVGMKVTWPIGKAAQGNDGVAAEVSNTPGAIGYVELTYAIRHKLSFGLVENPAGRFVQANLTTLNAAAKAIPATGDPRRPLLNAAGEDAYPITTLTWILRPKSTDNPQKSAAIEDLLRWMLTSGQKESSGLGYLPLPKVIAGEELQRFTSARATKSGNP